MSDVGGLVVKKPRFAISFPDCFVICLVGFAQVAGKRDFIVEVCEAGFRETLAGFDNCLARWLDFSFLVRWRRAGELNVTINQTPALRRLSSLQSIWQLAGSVLPPACQGVMWSASMSSISKNLPHTGQIPFWRSYADRFWLHEKPLRFKVRSLRVSK